MVLLLITVPSKQNVATSIFPGLDYCGGEWKYPRSCSPDAKNCDYVARWEYNENTDKMNFTIVSNSPNKWTGIGFSDTPSMSLTDAIIGT
jgi:hypothetical protein